MLKASQITRRLNGSGIFLVSLTLRRGEVKVIMGPSGSGKTTLLRILALLDQPDEGVLELDDVRFAFPHQASINPRWNYPRLTLVFQQLFLWPHLTNRENIQLALGRPLVGVIFEELINSLEIHPFLDKFPNQTSLGQRQRVALARALALKPDYLLLDEATSALDRALTVKVAKLLRKYVDNGLGLLAVTHDNIFAEALGCSERLWMENGKLYA